MVESGIHLVHKAVGQSSFDVIRGFKRRAFEAGQKKLALGHGGTLDPFADGLLLVLAGQATRLMELMHPLPKTYVAEVAWGVETDTCDLHGKPVSENTPTGLTPEVLAAALAPFLGWTDQVPPATSAKKIDGEAAYKKAHRGEEVVMKPCLVSPALRPLDRPRPAPAQHPGTHLPGRLLRAQPGPGSGPRPGLRCPPHGPSPHRHRPVDRPWRRPGEPAHGSRPAALVPVTPAFGCRG